MIVRSLTLLLLLLASAAAPQVRGFSGAVDEIRASQLGSAQIVILEIGGSETGSSSEPSPPPGPPSRSKAAVAERPAFGLAPQIEIVVLARPPRSLAHARAAELRDERLQIRRWRHPAPHLEAAPPNA